MSEGLRAHLEGRLSPHDYLEAQIQRAVAHLPDVVPAERVQLIREVLREQVVQSPGFVELLKGAGVKLPASTAT